KGDETMLVQYEGKWLDDLKLLKMDFLGLKTLTIIDKTKKLVKDSQGIDLDIDNVDLFDKKSYELFSKGLTDGIFQFESPGMKANLKNLKPNVFEDLIAMVALYRPGPMKFIDTFINRKHGREKVVYDHPLTESTLKETYGVTVYQEQVMQISKEMANFSSQDAGVLRKAISKKKGKLLAEMYSKFKEGSLKNGVSEKTIDKIWKDWEDFAKYAFNKSHAACYAYIAFQTAYLKAHYPVEFMAALLTQEKDPKKIPYFMEECKNMGIIVRPPNVNLSTKAFTVKGDQIIFGLHALKNVGEAAISSIISEREENGNFENIFTFAKRVDTSSVSKAVFESLIYAGAFDDFEGNRAQFYDAIGNAIDYASGFQAEKKRGQLMLFDIFEEDSEETYHPILEDIPEWGRLKELELEKEILGFYISGHPLNRHKKLIKLISNIFTNEVGKEGKKIPSNLIMVGMLESKQIKYTRKNDPFGIFTLEDMYGRFEISLFGDDYHKFSQRLEIGKTYFLKGKRNDFRNDDDMIRMIPQKIVEISKLQNSLSGEITLSLNEDDLTKGNLKKIISILNEHKGKINLKFLVKTKEFKTLILHSRKFSIYPKEEFMKNIEEFGKDMKFEIG
ncbi:MAG: DNA polymerase III subunit alpha, partial [Candidatus Cloacimonadota bacterium]|nr:DNA polymerase III subunit alpha [Candidatus Cloacimonadota bacterium]